MRRPSPPLPPAGPPRPPATLSGARWLHGGTLPQPPAAGPRGPGPPPPPARPPPTTSNASPCLDPPSRLQLSPTHWIFPRRALPCPAPGMYPSVPAACRWPPPPAVLMRAAGWLGSCRQPPPPRQPPALAPGTSVRGRPGSVAMAARPPRAAAEARPAAVCSRSPRRWRASAPGSPRQRPPRLRLAALGPPAPDRRVQSSTLCHSAMSAVTQESKAMLQTRKMSLASAPQWQPVVPAACGNQEAMRSAAPPDLRCQETVPYRLAWIWLTESAVERHSYHVATCNLAPASGPWETSAARSGGSAGGSPGRWATWSPPRHRSPQWQRPRRCRQLLPVSRPPRAYRGRPGCQGCTAGRRGLLRR
mmetsp:Transcript_56139/g.155451  ORF Transcript_56139/g.155451 Transcript_56139/m.155451 type:complete len:361 (+) Transcript_56139:427-1509(+)